MPLFALCFVLLNGPLDPPPTVDVPAIEWRDPEAIDKAWYAIRKTEGVGKQVQAIWRQGLERWTCPDLVDLQALAGASEAGLAWKDVVRGRGWARAALARVLIAAHADWRGRYPGQALAVGDVAQAGCGQVDPGVLVRLVSGDEAEALRARAMPAAGFLTTREIVRAGGLADDPSRFTSPDDRILVEQVIVAAGSEPARDVPLLRVQVRRYRALPELDPTATRALLRDVRHFVAHAELVLETRGPDPDGTVMLRRHYVDRAGERQAVLVFPAVRGGLRLEALRDVRIGPFLAKRPGAWPSETRWLAAIPSDTADTAAADLPSFSAWELLEEGAHATHMAGRDADLSYPVSDARLRFVEAVDAVDYAATWDWIVSLAAAGERLEAPIDAIIVGPRILRGLLQAVPEARTSPLVRERIVRVVAGHDDHQHIRIAVPSDAVEATARAALTGWR